MKHTKGPWNIETFDNKIPVVKVIKSPNGEADKFYSTISNDAGFVLRLDFGYGKQEDEANARLIATAPELLEVLERHIELHARITSGEIRDYHTIRQKLTHASVDAREAIKKAKA